ncbi:NUDIX domain-containing protein [Schaalia odontolytica]|uniref:NUDIX domain-containing protein n=1 Tax=Schaalia odontolytica TaxID=1660 RepID=UPI001D07D9ED|nr:NUDIX domain-containing protein [Schaalia odontolytica]MCB6402523.1 NUDIX domain-containing protein [Schaalia odontolytica]
MPRPVVAAAIVDALERPTELLACSRAYPQELRGQFELPGGKIEEGEDAVAALEREIAEELGARLRVGERVAPEGGLWWPILGGRVMGVWLAEVAPGSPSPRAGASHVEACWVPIGELVTLPWIGADLPIVEAVVARCGR